MPFMANAQENVQGIIVELKNGDKVEFKLSENPKFTFDGAKVVIKTEETEIIYSPTDILKVKLGSADPSSNINNLKKDDIQIEYYKDYVLIRSLRKGDEVNVYSVSGALLKSYRVDETNVNIPLSNLPKGVSVIRVNKLYLKIIKK